MAETFDFNQLDDAAGKQVEIEIAAAEDVEEEKKAVASQAAANEDRPSQKGAVNSTPVKSKIAAVVIEPVAQPVSAYVLFIKTLRQKQRVAEAAGEPKPQQN